MSQALCRNLHQQVAPLAPLWMKEMPLSLALMKVRLLLTHFLVKLTMQPIFWKELRFMRTSSPLTNLISHGKTWWVHMLPSAFLLAKASSSDFQWTLSKVAILCSMSMESTLRMVMELRLPAACAQKPVHRESSPSSTRELPIFWHQKNSALS